jgi:hypothetical protein
MLPPTAINWYEDRGYHETEKEIYLQIIKIHHPSRGFVRPLAV